MRDHQNPTNAVMRPSTSPRKNQAQFDLRKHVGEKEWRYLEQA
jgi:hypothetical protein